MTSASPLRMPMSQSALQAWECVKGLRGLLCSLSGLKIFLTILLTRMQKVCMFDTDLNGTGFETVQFLDRAEMDRQAKA